MAVSEIIGAVCGVLLLIIVAHLFVGYSLASADTAVNAQKVMTLQQETRLRTHFTINSISQNNSMVCTNNIGFINISLMNTGSEIICDCSDMDIFVDNTGDYRRLTPDNTHDNMLWNPHTTMWVNASSSYLCNHAIQNVAVVTANGEYDLGGMAVHSFVPTPTPAPTPIPALVANFSWYSTTYENKQYSVTFTDTSTGGPTSWYWDFVDGTSTVQNPYHTYHRQATYYVILTVTRSSDGATSSIREAVWNQP